MNDGDLRWKMVKHSWTIHNLKFCFILLTILYWLYYIDYIADWVIETRCPFLFHLKCTFSLRKHYLRFLCFHQIKTSIFRSQLFDMEISLYFLICDFFDYWPGLKFLVCQHQLILNKSDNRTSSVSYWCQRTLLTISNANWLYFFFKPPS